MAGGTAPTASVGYVTALAATDTAGGWRRAKPGGGVLLEVPGRGRRPRALDAPLAALASRAALAAESGTGSLGFVDLAAGRYESVAALPGFTRGLDFHGNLAFVGLSQVRETAVFSGIPIAERR